MNAPAVEWAEARDAAGRLTMHRTVCTTKKDRDSSVSHPAPGRGKETLLYRLLSKECHGQRLKKKKKALQVL